MGGRNFGGRFREHRWFDRDRPTARRQSGAVRIQWYLAEEKELGTREPAVSQRMGFCSRCRRSFAAGSRNGICPSNRRRGDIAGYWINRRFMFMGRWLRHAYYPNWNLRLFRHALGRYEKLTDAPTHSGDNEVHEHVLVDGRTAKLEVEIDHYAFPSIDVFVEKHNRYSNWEAQVAAAAQLDPTSGKISSQTVSRRRKLKTLSQRLPFRPWLRFLYVYVWQKGFLDGAEGYYFARLHGFYEFLSVAKTRELLKEKESAS